MADLGSRDGGGGRKLGRRENWLGLGGNRGLNSVVEIEESIWGAPAIYGDGCLGIELLQILFAVADSMKEIWDHPSYAGRRNHVLYSPPNRLWPCSFWWGGVGGKKLGRKRQVHTIIIICNTQCHLQWQCLREKIDHFKLFGWFKLSALENQSYQTLRPESICWL